MLQLSYTGLLASTRTMIMRVATRGAPRPRSGQSVRSLAFKVHMLAFMCNILDGSGNDCCDVVSVALQSTRTRCDQQCCTMQLARCLREALP